MYQCLLQGHAHISGGVRLHTDNPAWGARQLSAQLKKREYQVGRRKTRCYMNEMGIDPIYPKMKLSKRMQQAKVCPYLLRNAVIDRRHYIHLH
ncbi:MULTISPECIES: IS3 family transposase [Dorea]|uniref:IS3 family transposase n=1 Tax=Dorea TaxID=189330 RepID=UPI002FE4FD24